MATMIPEERTPPAMAAVRHKNVATEDQRAKELPLEVQLWPLFCKNKHGDRGSKSERAFPSSSYGRCEEKNVWREDQRLEKVSQGQAMTARAIEPGNMVESHKEAG